jgi:hypothetical protein
MSSSAQRSSAVGRSSIRPACDFVSRRLSKPLGKPVSVLRIGDGRAQHRASPSSGAAGPIPATQRFGKRPLCANNAARSDPARVGLRRRFAGAANAAKSGCGAALLRPSTASRRHRMFRRRSGPRASRRGCQTFVPSQGLQRRPCLQ